MRLGVDFGTSNTVGMLQRPDRSVTPLLFDSSPLLSSAVHAGPDAAVLTGADAERAALARPDGLEPHPKRRVDDGTAWLGEREHAIVDLVATVLSREWAEACRVGGAAPSSVVLTHPAVWARTRLAVLTEAAARAGMSSVTLVPEPAAAAAYFAAILGRDVPPGHALVVYDLGAGTFDVSVVRREPHGFAVVATGGLADLGGLDLDAVVVAHARSLTSPARAAWARLDWPESTADQRARRDLWLGARAAKELLSRHAQADLHVPLVEVDLHVTRTEFEAAARPLLDRTTATTLEVLRSAGVTREHTAGVFLVGGSSRIPLVAALLHQRLGIAPTVIDQPELVVAHGALHVPVRPGAETPPAAPEPAAPPPTPTTERPVGPAVPRAAPAVRTSPRPAVLGIPPRGVVSSDFPVHLVELTIGGRVGYTVRTYPDEGETAVFASVGDRLPLFARPEQAGDFAAGTDGHAMTAVLHWEALAETMAAAFLPLLPRNRYRLDLPPVTLERPPKEWLVDVVVEAGTVARELVNALDVDEAYALLAEGTPLDRLDDALRVARRVPFGRGRRELRAFDHRALAAGWRRVADLIDARVDWW